MNTPSSSAQLHYVIQGEGDPIVLIHGLFGSARNLGMLARDLQNDHQVISVDLRNHGQSFHARPMTYPAMAQDVLQLLESLNLKSVILVGHSMGGKVAMTLAGMAPERIQQLIVLDMAPVTYQQRRHDDVFAGLQSVIEHQASTRQEALGYLSQHIDSEGVIQFLAKSLVLEQGQFHWRFHVQNILEHYTDIQAWSVIEPFYAPTLFLKGSESNYITADHHQAIKQQFPNSKAHIIANTGHWLHAENPKAVLRVMRRFITQSISNP